MIEKNVLLPLVEEFINSKCISTTPTDDEEQMKLKSFIKKDENNCYSIFDRDHSIKCVFDKQILEDYLAEQPSHIKFENFENSLILVKKYYLDLLLVKNLNGTSSLRILLYIQDFEVDIAQKSKDKNIKKNINSHPSVIGLLKDFLNEFSKESVNKNFKFQPLQAINFMKKEFPISTEEDDHSSYKNKSIFKVLGHGRNNYLLNTQITLENQQPYLQETNVYSEEQEQSDNINIENLLKIDFTKIFHKNPTQIAIGRKENDFSPIPPQFPKDDEEKGEVLKFLSRKTYRDDPEMEKKRKRLLDTMPDSLREIARKYKDKKFTIDLYERYRVYKASTKFIQTK